MLQQRIWRINLELALDNPPAEKGVSHRPTLSSSAAEPLFPGLPEARLRVTQNDGIQGYFVNIAATASLIFASASEPVSAVTS